MISSIAHPTDLSPEGTLAFEHALGLALVRRCRLDVLHVNDAGQPSDWGAFPHVREVLQRWGLLQAGAPVESVLSQTGVSVRKVSIRDNDPVEGMARFLTEHNSDLIVMASHGRAGIERLMNGSVSAALAKVSKVPTLIIGPKARPFIDFATGAMTITSVLVPVDHSPDPRQAMPVLEDLAKGLGVALDFVHVGDAAPSLQSDRSTPNAVRLLQGPVVETLLAQAQDASLMAMPMIGPHGFADALRGSTTERVLHEATCPVLAVPCAS